MSLLLVAVLAALAAASGAVAHDKMNTPAPRVASEGPSGATDCSLGTTLTTPVQTVKRGELLHVAWDLNHNNRDVTLEIAPAADTPDFAGQGIDMGVHDYLKGYTDAPIPSGATDGDWTLRWTWAGYITCADLTVAGACPAYTPLPELNNSTLTGQAVAQRAVVFTNANSAMSARRLIVSSSSSVLIDAGSSATRGCEPATLSGTPADYKCFDLPASGESFFDVVGTNAIIDVVEEAGDCASYTHVCVPRTQCTDPINKCGTEDAGCMQGVSCGGCEQHTNQSTCNVQTGFCECQPSTCQSLGLQCGTDIDDGCGNLIQCGGCAAGTVCSLGQCLAQACNNPNTTCQAQGATCGSIGVLCDAPVGEITQICGTCTAPSTCQAATQSCVCVPSSPTTACDGNTCGAVSDGCGGFHDCSCAAAAATCGPTGICSVITCPPNTIQRGGGCVCEEGASFNAQGECESEVNGATTLSAVAALLIALIALMA